MIHFKNTDTASFVVARQQLHQAIQIPAAVARSFLPYRQDDSHASLDWLSRPKALASQWIGHSSRYRLALRFEDFTLLWLDGNLQIMGAYALHDRTFSDCLAWTAYWLEVIGFSPADFQWKLPYALPDYATDQGKRFSYDPEGAFDELAHYFSLVDALLRANINNRKDASPVRCWPHHFDLSTLITLQPHQDPEKIRSVSAGLSPGDAFYPEPYAFITPWPYPEASEELLPDLGEGSFWHRHEWVGVVLPAKAIAKKESQAAQRARLQTFFDRGLSEMITLVS